MRNAGADSVAALGVVLDLLNALQQADIAYCYWKSSRRLEAALAGLSDLDLLLARDDRERTLGVLLARGFKRLAPASSPDGLAAMNWIGHDSPSGRVVHVHLYFRLALGPNLLKPWRPPWETALLARAVPHPSIPVRMLDPASEAVLLLVRACLEFDRGDVVALRRWRSMARKFAADRAALAPCLDHRVVRQCAAALLGEEIAEAVADAAHRGEPPPPRLRRQVRTRLAPYRGTGPLESRWRLAARSVRFLADALNKRLVHAPRPWNRRILGGGTVVAIVGVDGSGKSTLVRALREWLGAEVDVLPLYFGTGEGRASLPLLPLKSLVPLARGVLRRRPAEASRAASGQAPGLLYSLLVLLWASVLAVEKRKKLTTARRAAERGMLVITDRWPQDQIAGFNDGPLLPRLRGIPRWLRRFESNAYQLAGHLPPDLAIKLRASPELIARREPVMDPKVARQRAEELMRLDFPASRIAVLDASQPLAEVVAAAKREVWAIL